MTNFDIVRLEQFGEGHSLEPLARLVFGDGNRPQGWFSRKLHREAVDPGLSVVALDAGRPYGYVLVGAPLGKVARTAGVGVEPERRGRGVGTQMLEVAARAARRRGFSRLRTLAEPPRVAFYSRAGFVGHRTNHSLLSFAVGDDEPLGLPRGWDDLGDCIHESASWMEMAWERTPRDERATIHIDESAVVHLSREGSAYLVHRLTTKDPSDAGVLRIVSSLLRMLPRPRPVLLYGCNAVSSVTSSLLRAGWSPVQTALVMERPLKD